MKTKPFLTIDEQMNLLRSRGLDVNESARLVLMREGYYAVVNGYKDIFIDPVATSMADDDRFMSGASFDHISLLYEFDRKLREFMFPLFARAESILRTAIAYNYSKEYKEHDAYLDSDTYCSKEEYFDKNNYIYNRNKLIEVLQKAYDNEDLHNASIDHYKNNYGFVPLWVLINALTFGNLSNMYSLQKESIRLEICKTIGYGQKAGYLSSRQLRSYLTTMVRFRNTCAHNGRLYCYMAGKNHDRSFADAMRALRFFVGKESFLYAENKIRDLIILLDDLPYIQNQVMQAMHITLSNDEERNLIYQS